MKPGPTTVAPEVIACIAEGRSPGIDELFRVADRIWTDMHGAKSAFAWSDVDADDADRLISIKAAQAALIGGS